MRTHVHHPRRAHSRNHILVELINAVKVGFPDNMYVFISQ